MSSHHPMPPGDPVQSGPERPVVRRRGRIVFTLLLVLVCIGLAPLATVAWKLIDIHREALATAQQEYQLLVASAVAHELDIHVEGLRSQLVRVAQSLGGAGRRSGADQQEEVRRVLNDVLDGRMLYLRYTYFTAQERRSIAAGELPESLDPVFDSGLLEATQILARNAQSRTESAILSDPIVLDQRPRRAVMVVSAPVVSRGRFRGVLSALVDLSAVWQSVVERNRTGHAIFALDRSGRVIASTNPVQVAPGSEASRSDLVVRYLTAERLASVTMPYVESGADGDEPYIGSYTVTEQEWGIFVNARLQDVYLPVQRTIESVLTWALFALALAVLAAIIFADTLARPIKRLAAASRAFAAGDFSVRAGVRSRNEIGELAHTFNTMAEEIEDHIRRLRAAAEENKELFLGTIRTMAQAIDAKDPYTRGHSVRVNRYSVLIARQLGLREEEIADIHVASLMHDVGKIGIHDAILQKPGKLTPDEFEAMKTHTVKGAQILAPIRQMQHIIPGLRWHHERWKGGGYPDGLAGKKIPQMARIIAVADTFDAMTTHRPYQRAMTFDQALETLNKLKGVAFDEPIVEAFNRAYTQGLVVPEGGVEEASQPRPAPHVAVAAPAVAGSAQR